MKLTGISYVTPMVRYDPDAKVVVIQHRNTETGEVSRQFPSQRALQDLRVSGDTAAAKPGSNVSLTV
jgi:hypothetical protein